MKGQGEEGAIPNRVAQGDFSEMVVFEWGSE